MKKQKTLSLSGRFTARYVLETPRKPKELLLLLHGYSESGRSYYERLASVLPGNAAILAPNAPFPIPVPDGKSYQLGFSWYFYEASADEYYIDMKLARNYLVQLIKVLGFEKLPKRIIGYSQGGYLSPFLGIDLKNMTQIIGINCQFLDEELPRIPNCRLDQINGENDKIVDPENARTSFEKIKGKKRRGEFVMVPEAGHGISDPILDALKTLLSHNG